MDLVKIGDTFSDLNIGITAVIASPGELDKAEGSGLYTNGWALWDSDAHLTKEHGNGNDSQSLRADRLLKSTKIKKQKEREIDGISLPRTWKGSFMYSYARHELAQITEGEADLFWGDNLEYRKNLKKGQVVSFRTPGGKFANLVLWVIRKPMTKWYRIVHASGAPWRGTTCDDCPSRTVCELDYYAWPEIEPDLDRAAQIGPQYTAEV